MKQPNKLEKPDCDFTVFDDSEIEILEATKKVSQKFLPDEPFPWETKLVLMRKNREMALKKFKTSQSEHEKEVKYNESKNL